MTTRWRERPSTKSDEDQILDGDLAATEKNLRVRDGVGERAIALCASGAPRGRRAFLNSILTLKITNDDRNNQKITIIKFFIRKKSENLKSKKKTEISWKTEKKNSQWIGEKKWSDNWQSSCSVPSKLFAFREQWRRSLSKNNTRESVSKKMVVQLNFFVFGVFGIICSTLWTSFFTTNSQNNLTSFGKLIKQTLSFSYETVFKWLTT